MKLGAWDSLFGNRGVAVVEAEAVEVSSNLPSSTDNSTADLKVFGGGVAELFVKPNSCDQSISVRQPTINHAFDSVLKRREEKIAKLERQVDTLTSEKHQLIGKVFDQTKLMAKLTKTISDKDKKAAKLNKIILSQKDHIEEMDTKSDEHKRVLQWYNKTNDNLCKRLVDSNRELLELKKIFQQKI